MAVRSLALNLQNVCCKIHKNILVVYFKYWFLSLLRIFCVHLDLAEEVQELSSSIFAHTAQYFICWVYVLPIFWKNKKKCIPGLKIEWFCLFPIWKKKRKFIALQAGLDVESFEQYRNGLLAKLLEKDTSLTYETNRIWGQIVDKR